MRLPYFRNRTYLSGIDWIICGIDNFLRKTSGVGNHSTLIIRLKSKLSEGLLEARLNDIYKKLPILSSKIKRDKLNLAPYWYYSKRHKNTYNISEYKINNEEEFDHIKTKILNEGFKTKYHHLKFHLLNGTGKYYLFMTFDHKVFDAHGAEMFLELLSREPNQFRDKLIEVKQTNAAKLINWQEKFDAGKDIQRHLIHMSAKDNKDSGLCSIQEILKSIKPQTQRSQTIIYSEKETDQIKKNSEKTAGFMMETPYFLAVCTRAVETELYKEEHPMYYSIPMPIDMRKSNLGLRKLLRNHLSFMFLQVEVNGKDTLKDLSFKYRTAILNEVRNEYPEKLQKATRLARICPLGILRRFMELSMKGKVCSFAFANLGESLECKELQGMKVEHISHMPRIPTPPGIGFFFNIYAKKLQFTVTWNKSIIEKNQVDAIVYKINECFKAEVKKNGF